MAGEREDEFMRSGTTPLITNVSVHEVWPGHYLQFLYAKNFPSDVRKVFGAASNIEGWAHYCEQMVIDEGFHADDPKLPPRAAPGRAAARRALHRRHPHAYAGHDDRAGGGVLRQGGPSAAAGRAVGDASAARRTRLYGYYTMGKLMILKLRDDYKAKMGDRIFAAEFHDAFIELGPLPLPLIRKAMLGETGQLF